MRADRIPGRQDFQCAAVVETADFLGVDPDLPRQDRVGGDELLYQAQVVGSLIFIVRDDQAIVAGWAVPSEEAVERGEGEVSRLVVLFGATYKRAVVMRATVNVEGVQRLVEGQAAIRSCASRRRSAIVRPAGFAVPCSPARASRSRRTEFDHARK